MLRARVSPRSIIAVLFWGIAGGMLLLTFFLLLIPGLYEEGGWHFLRNLFVGAAFASAGVAALAPPWLMMELRTPSSWTMGWCLSGVIAGWGSLVGWMVAEFPLMEVIEAKAAGQDAGLYVDEWMFGFLLVTAAYFIPAAAAGGIVGLVTSPLVRTVLVRLTRRT